jgi:haloalkane dehalogenase
VKKVLRTPDACFENLSGYSFTPNYVNIDHAGFEPLRMHYVDEGNPDGNVVLLLHGCPAWSYLYRKVIPVLASAGFRVIAPDHIGCGRSDKLPQGSDYSYENYVNWMQQFINTLALENITLVCQDWGGPIGLRTFSAMPEKFTHILVTNTLLPNCEPVPNGIADWPGELISNWINFTANADDLPVGGIIQGVTVTELDDDVLAGYDAPYPDASYKQGILQWPSLIPVSEDRPGIKENRAVWQLLENTDIPFLTAFSDQDPSTADWEKVFQYRVKGAQGIAHKKIADAGHMVQEDQGEALANIILDFIAA